MKSYSRLAAASLSAALLAACGGNHSAMPTTVSSARIAVPEGATLSTSRGAVDGTNLYVANSGGKSGPGDVTVYGLKLGKLLQTIASGINRPSVIGFDSVANAIVVANTVPEKDGNSGSVALYSPGSRMPAKC